MYPSSQLPFFYSHRNTAFCNASSSNDVLAGHLSMYRTGKNMMVQCQDCKVDAALLSIQIL
jgi:hypothetical protein